MNMSIFARKVLSKTPKIVQKLGNSAMQNAPTVLTVAAISGVAGTAVLAAKAGAKADRRIRDMKIDKQQEYDRNESDTAEVSKKDIFKAAAPIYAPTAISGLVTIGCIIGSRSIDAKRQAALAALYASSEWSFRDYRDKVAESIGSEKEDEITNHFFKDEATEHMKAVKAGTPVPGHGEYLCFDTLSGRYFRSSREEICKAANEINRMIINEMWVTLNEFYMELGLDSISLGESIGWNVDRLLEVDITSQIEDTTGEPYLQINYPTSPARFDLR